MIQATLAAAMPRRRALLAGALAAGLLGVAPSSTSRARTLDGAGSSGGAVAAPELSPHAVPFDVPALPADHPMRVLGGLEFRGGSAVGLSGLSAVHLAPDLTLTLVSDLASHAQARLVLDEGSLRPLGIAGLRTGRLRDGSGTPLRRGYAGDSEALARQPDGTWLVAFERWHRIRAYRDLDGPGAYVEAPPGIERAPANGGLESLAVLPDGRWLAIAESLPAPDAPGAVTAWIGGPGAWRRLAYRPMPGFEPSDAAPLPDGGLLVLERYFSIFRGFAGRLVRIPAAALADPSPDAVLEGEELLRLSSPMPVDNWEGVSVVRHQGRLLVALVSDDNENRLQRSMLLLLELREDERERAAAPAATLQP